MKCEEEMLSLKRSQQKPEKEKIKKSNKQNKATLEKVSVGQSTSNKSNKPGLESESNNKEQARQRQY